ncbi:PTS-dependent dihydroxyacetone kinase phosphotransferase subunit DhaM [Candidatus Gracilibacteria bacterium]|nr:PTS-dependent dihydroxyacetone kinase phosphotransferase subunit DhaM [Candidatus Gracilibacteria bacterium]
MIGILIISHSANIARGVKELADQMARGRVRIAAAGGTLEGELGTSVDVITRALDELSGVDTVLALVDLGSAVMSAEMALEMSGLPFVLSKAPLVEGALVAAVEATREGIGLQEVAALAERALEAKGIGPATSTATESLPPAAAVAEAVLHITNSAGLHMRPANLFIQTASRFQSIIRARNLDRPERPDGNVKSMLDVMKLGVASGQRLAVRAEGDDADAAIAALSALVQSNFGE